MMGSTMNTGHSNVQCACSVQQYEIEDVGHGPLRALARFEINLQYLTWRCKICISFGATRRAKDFLRLFRNSFVGETVMHCNGIGYNDNAPCTLYSM